MSILLVLHIMCGQRCYIYRLIFFFFFVFVKVIFSKTHSSMQEWLEKSPAFALDSKDNLGLDSLVVLLKCLKIMENTTFLSKDNQV